MSGKGGYTEIYCQVIICTREAPLTHRSLEEILKLVISSIFKVI